jgi:hypothetical protein
MPRAALALVLFAACAADREPATLDDDLGGVWTMSEGARPAWRPGELDLRDRGATIAIHPMWDSSVDPAGRKPLLGEPGVTRSPWQLELRRRAVSNPGGGMQGPTEMLTGELVVHLRDGAVTCARTSQATLRRVPGGLELGLREPDSDCTAPHSPLRRVLLRRK